MTTEIRANLYGGNCGNCRTWVEAGAGRIDRPHGHALWITYHLTVADCEAAKAAPASTIPNRYEGGCTRCGEAVAPGEGTLRRLDYTWGQLTHDRACDDRGVIERHSAGDFANEVDPWPDTFEQDGRWYHVTWERWSKTQCIDTDEWHPAVHQVARLATEAEIAPVLAERAEAKRRRDAAAHQHARERARAAQVPDAETDTALAWWREHLAHEDLDRRDQQPRTGPDRSDGHRDLPVGDLMRPNDTRLITIEGPGVPDRSIWCTGWIDHDFVALSLCTPWSPEGERMAELVSAWQRRPLPDLED